MVTEEQYLDAKKIVDEFESQSTKSRITPRYFVDIRSGCGAVRDRWHKSYDKDYPGLHHDTPDIIDYRHGYQGNGVWNMSDVDIKYLNYLCVCLNKVSSLTD